MITIGPNLHEAVPRIRALPHDNNSILFVGEFFDISCYEDSDDWCLEFLGANDNEVRVIISSEELDTLARLATALFKGEQCPPSNKS